MPDFKVLNASHSKRRSVVATTYDELVKKVSSTLLLMMIINSDDSVNCYNTNEGTTITNKNENSIL